MIKEFVAAFEAGKETLRQKFAAKHPDNYGDIVRAVVEIIAANIDDDVYPKPTRIHQIDDGEYDEGTLLFVIAADSYQPSNYWFVKVHYGACSGCDTLQAIRSYDDDPPTTDQVNSYMTLALHVVQKLKSMNEPDGDPV